MITIPGKIPISIRPLFWLVAFLIGWLWTASLPASLVCVVVILFSVIIHELGHSFAALVFKQKVRVEIAAFGGFTYREGDRLKLWKEFIVVICGPLAGFLLCLGAYAIVSFVPIQNALLAFAVKVTFLANLFWTIINLIPVLPLDGGHLLSIVLEGIFGFKGVKWAIIVGLVIAICISIAFFALGMFLAGALFLFLTFESFRSLRYYKIYNETDRDPKWQELMKQAEEAMINEQRDEAERLLLEVRNGAKDGILFTMASSRLAEIYHDSGRNEEAYELLEPIKKHLSGAQLSLFHVLAFKHADYDTVIKIGNRCYQDAPSYKTALINSLAYAAMKEAEPAIGWLECAIREGLPSLKETIDRKEFDLIRDDPRFKKFL